MQLNKTCNNCNISLTIENAAKNGIRNGRVRYRNKCNHCNSKRVVQQSRGSERKKEYARLYLRKVGIVKEYPCETCSTPCYKKYERAFCSDKCRFLAYVEKTDTCWLWIGAKNKKGYGKFCFKENKTAIASRVSYELFIGELEKDKYICHSCDNPSCVNPDHLWMGTHMDNMMDMVEKERQYSKVKSMDVYKMRKLHEKGYGSSKLAEMYNLTVPSICSILKYRCWKHI